MVTSTPSVQPPADESLGAAIVGAARRMRTRSLGLILLAGVAGILATTLIWGVHLTVTIPLVMPTAFAVWGLAEHGERALEADGPETRPERFLLRLLRVAMVVVGVSAAVATLFMATFAVTGQGGLQMR